jgi:predicted Zn-dependent peptidase
MGEVVLRRNMDHIFINKPGNSTLVAMIVLTGRFCEENKFAGISHFIEHMLFKGTKNRTCKEISANIENIGGELNAYTGWEDTCFWAKVGNSYKETAKDVIIDLVINAALPEKEIDKERDVIIQELKMYEDDPQDGVYEIFNRNLYSPHSGFYLPIIGSNESLKRINKQELDIYYNQKYSQPILIIIGDVKEDIQLNIDFVTHQNKNSYKEIKQREVLIEREDITQSNIIIGNTTNIIGMSKLEQTYYFDILDAVYGDMGGRLFDKVREDAGLVYRIGFEWEIYNNGFLQWQVVTGLDKGKIKKAQKLITQEISKPLTKTEKEMILDKAIGAMEMRLDNAHFMNHNILYALSLGINYQEFLYGYKKNLKKAIKNINEFIEIVNFKDQILAGVVPKNQVKGGSLGK